MNMKSVKKMQFRLIGKIGLLLVVIGFFMPIACDMNGFEIADSPMNRDNTFPGIAMYLLFASAAAGVCIGIMLLLTNKKLNPTNDWIVTLVCIASGLFVFFSISENRRPDLDTGAYFIIAGWIVAVVGQLLAKVNREA